MVSNSLWCTLVHSGEWHLDELSGLMTIVNIVSHADQRPHLTVGFLVLLPTLKAFEHWGKRKQKFSPQL